MYHATAKWLHGGKLKKSQCEVQFKGHHAKNKFFENKG
jgi:hypothetical protein